MRTNTTITGISFLVILYSTILLMGGCRAEERNPAIPEQGQGKVEVPKGPVTNWAKRPRLKHKVLAQYLKEKGMVYLIMNDQVDGGVYAINLTKDSLEVELLKSRVKMRLQ